MKTAIERIQAERQRQIDKEGWSLEHDDRHDDQDLAYAAAAMAAPETVYVARESHRMKHFNDCWPWGVSVPAGRSAGDPNGYRLEATVEKKFGKSRMRQLEIAGALIVAEMERLERANK